MALIRTWRRDALPVATGTWHVALNPAFTLPRSPQHWSLRHRGPHSYIYDIGTTAAAIAKLIVPRSQPRDTLRKYMNCQARREFASNLSLARIGLRCPQVHGWGVSLSPTARFESILFMQTLPAFISGLDLIRRETDADRRRTFLRLFASQLATLHGHGLIHKDCHFGNLCLTANDTLFWIDNDIRRAGSRAARRAGFKKTLALLVETARGDITNTEWQIFRDRLRETLVCWPMATELVHEI